MKMMMGKRKMGQAGDVKLAMGFMNPTVTRVGAAVGNVGNIRRANMGHKHAHMGKMKGKAVGGLRMGMMGIHAHMGKMKGKIAPAQRRVGNCGGLQGFALGRCRAAIKGGCVGLKGKVFKSCKAHRKRHLRKLLGGEWVLIKKKNGDCSCTQNPRGAIVLQRFHSQKECVNAQGHSC